MGRTFTKTEIDRLGIKFAEALRRNSGADPYKLPCLIKLNTWKKADKNERVRIVTGIAEVAAALLRSAGYSAEIVERATRPYIKY